MLSYFYFPPQLHCCLAQRELYNPLSKKRKKEMDCYNNNWKSETKRESEDSSDYKRKMSDGMSIKMKFKNRLRKGMTVRLR